MSETAKITPGPWRWEEGPPERNILQRLIGSDGTEVCNFGDREQYYPTAGSEPGEADARLIAAAPDLLDALQQAHCALESVLTDEQVQAAGLFRGEMLPRAVEAARVAIDKARGQS